MFQNTHVLKGIERICDKDKIFRRNIYTPPPFQIRKWCPGLWGEAWGKDTGRSQPQGHTEVPVKADRTHGRRRNIEQVCGVQGQSRRVTAGHQVTGEREGRLCLRSLTVTFYPSRRPGVRVNLAHPRLAWRCQRGDEGPGTISSHLVRDTRQGAGHLRGSHGAKPANFNSFNPHLKNPENRCCYCYLYFIEKETAA